MPNEGKEELVMNENHVHVEREKTKRTLIVACAITLVGLVCAVLFFQNIDNRGGALKITRDGVEVSLEKPLVNQVTADTQKLKVLGDTVSVSSGTISNLEIVGGSDSGGFDGKRFTGRNLIDTVRGFVFASEHPERWKVQTPSAGTDVISRLTSRDGSILQVRTTPIKGLLPLDTAIAQMLDSLRLLDPKAKAVKRDSVTWMIWYTHPATKRIYCTKIIDANGLRYIAESSTMDPNAKAELVREVAKLSVIAKPVSSLPTKSPIQRRPL